MSKKKSSGNTMTLKDFHGGSIPSDLRLPSAPGVVPKSTTDRPAFDGAPWGSSMGRTDQRTRPSSSHSIRNFDDKTPFLPNTANIGRNFSEDERKPLDGPSAPRRMVSDDVFRAPYTSMDVKSDSVLAGRLTSWQEAAGPWPVKKIDATHSGIGNQMIRGNNETSAWVSRREVTPPNSEPGQSPWATQAGVSKLVHVTAVEQVSSGRWHSKLVAPGQIENQKHSELENGLHKTNDYTLDRGDMVHQREHTDAMIPRHIEKGLGIEYGIMGRRKVSPTEVNDVNLAVNSSNRLYPKRSDAKYGVSSVQPTVPSETVERPKLKLLPRTKPLDNVERPLNDVKQESGTSAVVQRETGIMTHKSTNAPKPGSSADESGNQQAERPKLNLKPISQLLELPHVNPERERNVVFGGARPRELVLKERGIDETDHHELEQLERVKPNIPKTERIPEQTIPFRQTERPTNVSRETRTAKIDKKDIRNVSNTDRSETQRRNWRNNNDNIGRRNNMRENERQPQPLMQEKRNPSPETWRKPAEPTKSESSDETGQRYGKAASALELAQAFSKPFSDPRNGNNSFNNGQGGGLAGRNQVPFSRLIESTSTPSRRQINGY